MAHAYTNNLLHFVFSTKGRLASIPPGMQERLWAYIVGTGKKLGIPILAVGGMPDHLHILLALPPAMAPATAVQRLKANSSRWMRQHTTPFGWQEGYGSFSVSASLAKTVKAYIRNQPAHHKKRNFEQEFLTLLKKSGIPYDVKDVFD